MTAITMPSPTAKLSFGRVIQGTFGVAWRNLPAFLILIVGCLALPGIMVGLGLMQLRSGVSEAGVALVGLGYLAMMVGAAVLQPAMVHGAIADLNGRRATAGECVRTGLRHALPVFVILLLSVIAFGFGFVLLVAPGVMLLTAWLVAGPSQVVERTGVFAAFSRSGALTKGNRWRVFGLLVLYVIVYGVVQQVLLNVAGVGFAAQATAQAGNPFAALSPAYWAVMLLLTVVNTLVSYTGLAVIYYELRRVKEGVGPEALAAVFD
ncbi:hypothetical protein [Phenylobacterium sp.]|uniref:hypothetical protein n=1 Tax=Phenylobacterium sp. TaxID=1871053 RepID=UPI002F3F5979